MHCSHLLLDKKSFSDDSEHYGEKSQCTQTESLRIPHSHKVTWLRGRSLQGSSAPLTNAEWAEQKTPATASAVPSPEGHPRVPQGQSTAPGSPACCAPTSLRVKPQGQALVIGTKQKSRHPSQQPFNSRLNTTPPNPVPRQGMWRLRRLHSPPHTMEG